MKEKKTNHSIGRDAFAQSFKKLAPRTQIKNPVMFVVYIGAIFVTVLYFLGFAGMQEEAPWYVLTIAIILWATVLFANVAEAVAEGRGRAQADSLKKARRDVVAKKLKTADPNSEYTEVLSKDLKPGDIVLVKANEQIPMDGEVIEGVASVDESAITGESAPVIRESGGDRSAVTGGTTVVSDWLVVKVTAKAGESFLDKMIAMVEGAARKKTPNEIALQILLVTLTIIFLVVCATLLPFSSFVSELEGAGHAISLTNVVALIVCLAPTTIGALLSAIGIAGMSRLNQANVLAMSGRAIEAAGDVDVLLLDKTGTITLGNRQASEFLPVKGVTEEELADAAQLSSIADETAEGRSIVVLAKERFNIRGRDLSKANAEFIEFSAKTRMSGINLGGDEIRKGAAEAVIGDNETPLAEPRETEIGDNDTPLASHDHASCWVHWYIILGIIVTALYGACVALRRGLFSRKLKKYEDGLTGGGDPAPGAPSIGDDASAPIAPKGAPAGATLAAGLGE